MGKLGAGKPCKIRVSSVGCEFLIISAFFASTYSFTLGKWVFFGLFLLLQNLKVSIYKGYRVSGRAKKVKKNVEIADFLKIEARLKALSVRFWGIPEGGMKPL